MVIEYETSKYVTEKQQLEIEDTKNVFLHGRNNYDGTSTYFGTWTNDEYLVVVTLISGRIVSYEYSLNKNAYTDIDIQHYLRQNKNVEVISRDSFKKELERVTSILKI